MAEDRVSTPPQPFGSIGIAGLGLIGGSIALAVRHRWSGVRLIGFDRPERHDELGRLGVVDEVVGDFAGLGAADLVVLAAPLSVMIEWMPRVKDFESGTIVTDVGSTKRQVMEAARTAGLTSFVGGHPMGGSERAGLAHARPDLFEGRPWLLVSGTAPKTDSARVEHFAAALGATPQWMDAETHDRTIAYVSHLPQLIGVALMNAAIEAVGESNIAAASGRAFPEMTRLASSPPDLWQGILAKNADFVAEALDRFAAKFPAGDDLRLERWVREAFERAGAARERLLDRDID